MLKQFHPQNWANDQRDHFKWKWFTLMVRLPYDEINTLQSEWTSGVFSPLVRGFWPWWCRQLGMLILLLLSMLLILHHRGEECSTRMESRICPSVGNMCIGGYCYIRCYSLYTSERERGSLSLVLEVTAFSSLLQTYSLGIAHCNYRSYPQDWLYWR